MTTLTVSLSDSQKAFIDAQVAAGGFASASEYIARLIEGDQITKEHGRSDGQLVEGVTSAPPTPVTDQDWAEIHKDVVERLAHLEPKEEQTHPR